MQVFISWSGGQSKQIARALRDWLPLVIQAVKPYMSDKDNTAGSLWDQVITAELEASNFGILCLTPGNLDSPWIHFEAGAISKAVTSESRVVPLLFGLTPTDVGQPLARFQMKPLDKQGVRDTLTSMNSGLGEASLPDVYLQEVFDGLWPNLKAKLEAVRAGPEP